ncbi:hypothetical protein ELQ92_00430 [Labedella populi]|uniref:Uncharacterized protein n=1 Tax=Labedella populi TaxID=2498850 RepID=A0A444QE16_9MICO|nr:hypothetical protein [Labedella populi]RWZ67780.1 hypothetical protein ELQ92_00430 [Labedella populi]
MNRYSSASRDSGSGTLEPPPHDARPTVARGDVSPLGRASLGALFAAVIVSAPGLTEAYASAIAIGFSSLALALVESTRPTATRPPGLPRRRRVAPALVASVAVFIAAFAASFAAAAAGSRDLSTAIAGAAFILLFPLIWLDERSR